MIEGRQDDIEDFLKVKDFSYGCKQVYSGADRWTLIGEAGPFLDPFYSPGSDFIAMGNTLITDLIVRDLGGEDVTDAREAATTTSSSASTASRCAGTRASTCSGATRR